MSLFDKSKNYQKVLALEGQYITNYDLSETQDIVDNKIKILSENLFGTGIIKEPNDIDSGIYSLGGYLLPLSLTELSLGQNIQINPSGSHILLVQRTITDSEDSSLNDPIFGVTSNRAIWYMLVFENVEMYVTKNNASNPIYTIEPSEINFYTSNDNINIRGFTVDGFYINKGELNEIKVNVPEVEKSQGDTDPLNLKFNNGYYSNNSNTVFLAPLRKIDGSINKDFLSSIVGVNEEDLTALLDKYSLLTNSGAVEIDCNFYDYPAYMYPILGYDENNNPIPDRSQPIENIIYPRVSDKEIIDKLNIMLKTKSIGFLYNLQLTAGDSGTTINSILIPRVFKNMPYVISQQWESIGPPPDGYIWEGQGKGATRPVYRIGYKNQALFTMYNTHGLSLIGSQDSMIYQCLIDLDENGLIPTLENDTDVAPDNSNFRLPNKWKRYQSDYYTSQEKSGVVFYAPNSAIDNGYGTGVITSSSIKYAMANGTVSSINLNLNPSLDKIHYKTYILQAINKGATSGTYMLFNNDAFGDFAMGNSRDGQWSIVKLYQNKNYPYGFYYTMSFKPYTHTQSSAGKELKIVFIVESTTTGGVTTQSIVFKNPLKNNSLEYPFYPVNGDISNWEIIT